MDSDSNRNVPASGADVASRNFGQWTKNAIIGAQIKNKYLARSMHWVRSLFLKATNNEGGVRQVCLAFLDQQLVVGAGLMILATSKTCSVRVYHSEIAFRLAYCSVITYRCAEWFAAGRQHGKWSKAWRLVLLTILNLLLMSHRLIWQSATYMKDLTKPVSCPWVALGRGEGYPMRVIASLVVQVAYDAIAFCRSVDYILRSDTEPRFSLIKGWSTSIREAPANIRYISPLWVPMYTLYFSRIMQLAMAFSYLAPITVGLSTFRGHGASHMEEDNEDEWGFGQLFPVVLLILPLTSLAESLYGK